ncbi:MAG: hypothetical protein WCL44_06100 [bacterium]
MKRSSRTITLSELRTRRRAVTQSILRGNSVVVTYRGKPVAQLFAVGNGKHSKRSVSGVFDDGSAVASVAAFIETIRADRRTR